VLCSAVFVSHRAPEEAWRNSVEAVDAGYVIEGSRVTVGRRWAEFHGDQGCVIGPLHFVPQRVERHLPPDDGPWPMGEVTGDLDPRFDAALDAAFAAPDALTAAFIVVHHGRIVAERYAPGVTKDTALESWSMGKSLTATLLGLLVKDGLYDVNQKVMREVRIIDLLHMSGGLKFSSSYDPDWNPQNGVPDHSYIYGGAIDAFEYSLSRPQEFPPNTEGRYRNCDPLIIGALIKRAAPNYLQFPQRALFDRLGMRHMVLETDPFGNFLLTGHDYGSARDWARLGLLYAQDGMWQGERVLPEGWASLVSTPAPAWKKPEYGALFWLNRTREWPLPESAYMMVGYGGQKVFIVPSHDLVIVRMGHTRGSEVYKKSLDQALERLMQTLGTP
jgi:CubicO group peptidase (beta-lactamase class C family)